MDEFDVNKEIDDILSEGGDILFFPQAAVSAEPLEAAQSPRDEASASVSTEASPSPREEALPQALETETPKPSKPTGMKGLTPEELPREKALNQGINALTDVELLAILLGSGIRGKSVLEFARELLNDHENNLGKLTSCPIHELMRKYKGMGIAKATLLTAAMTFGQRAQAALKVPDHQITSSESVYEYMRDKLERNNHEEFWILHMSRANRVMMAEQLSKGGTAATVVDVKLIAKSAIDHLSSGIIVCHNHPSGNMTPSPQDDALTHRIVETCKLCDINVLDHVIIGPTGYYSYQDQGRLR